MLCDLVPTGLVRGDEQQLACSRGCKNKRGELRAIWVTVGLPVTAGRCKVAGGNGESLPVPGPGYFASQIFAAVGFQKNTGCQCPERIAQMDAWGPEGCRQNRDTIIEWFREAYQTTTWAEVFYAGRKLIDQPWFKITDQFGSIVDEAIKRAEVIRQPTNAPGASAVEAEAPVILATS